MMLALGRGRKAIVVTLLAVLLVASAVAYALVPHPTAPQQKPARPSILITDRHGRVLYEAIDPLGSKHVPLPLAAIPLACQHATVATEDERFYLHPGFDPLAILRSAWLNLKAGHTVSGASTLTQQLARNLLMDETERYEQSLRRKVREAWLAWRLEGKYSKDELLALYLNTTYYGHYATGIEAAAQAYFGMPAAELDLAQCALLAGLPQWPAGYNPIENPAAARRRQATVLRLMVQQGYVTQQHAEEAGAEDLRFASSPFPILAPHFVMSVQSQVESLLPAEQIAGGGLRVTTTLDLDWQEAGQNAVLRRLAQLRPCATIDNGLAGVTCDPAADPDRRVENAALVALDPGTGAIRAMIGSPDYFDAATSGAVNAALAQRQPGSAIKPLTYALAMDPAAARVSGRAPWTPATIIPDLRTSFTTAEGAPYVPNNYDRRYHGPVTLRTVLANSYNIAAVVALDKVGIVCLIDLARSLGIPWEPDLTLQKSAPDGEIPPDDPLQPRYGLSLTLGGGEVRLLDLTAAYGAFATGGLRVDPYAIERVETLSGELLWEHRAPSPVRVLDERVAFLITDILSDDAARQPAFGQASALEIGRPAAAKTGTTTDWRDNWTVGYTAEVVTGVWVGNADNTPMKDISGITGAGPIWHDFMVGVMRGRPVAQFAAPQGLAEIEVCADSGLLPGEVRLPLAGKTAQVVPCPQRRREWFIEGTAPTEIDRAHVSVLIDTRTGRLAGSQTATAYPQVFWVLDGEYRAWARENSFPQPPLELTAEISVPPAGDAADTRPRLRLVSPDPNRVLRIDPGMPASVQQLPVTAALSVDAVDVVALTLNGKVFATVNGPEYTAWWPLQPGRYVFRALATLQDGSVVTSEEVAISVE